MTASPEDPRWSLRLVDYPHDQSNPRVNLSTKLLRLMNLDHPSPSPTTDNRIGLRRMARRRM